MARTLVAAAHPHPADVNTGRLGVMSLTDAAAAATQELEEKLKALHATLVPVMDRVAERDDDRKNGDDGDDDSGGSSRTAPAIEHLGRLIARIEQATAAVDFLVRNARV